MTKDVAEALERLERVVIANREHYEIELKNTRDVCENLRIKLLDALADLHALQEKEKARQALAEEILKSE